MLILQRENVYQNFTFTRRASRTAIALGILVPGAIALVAMAYDVRLSPSSGDGANCAGKVRHGREASGREPDNWPVWRKTGG